LQLSEMSATYGDNQTALEEVRKALELSAGLPREQSLMIEARNAEALHQWERAIDLRRTLFNFFPDSLDHGLKLVMVQVAAGKGSESIATVDALRKLPPPDRNDPRIDWAEANAANVISDYKRMASASQQAITKARTLGARILLAQAKMAEARAYIEMGQNDKA